MECVWGREKYREPEKERKAFVWGMLIILPLSTYVDMTTTIRPLFKPLSLKLSEGDLTHQEIKSTVTSEFSDMEHDGKTKQNTQRKKIHKGLFSKVVQTTPREEC